MPHHTYKRHHLKRRHRARERRIVDRLTLIAALIGPISTIPQAIKVFVGSDSSAVALSTWIIYDLLSLIWIYYAIVHKERVIIMAQTLYIVVQTAIIIGAFQQGARR